MSSFFSSWFSSGSSNTSPSGDPSSTSTCPVAHDKPNTQQSPQNASAATPQAESRCPVDHKNMPPPQDHPFLKAQEVLRPGLERGLSTEREISSIPRLMGQATGAGTGAARGCPVPHEDRQQDPSASGHSAPNASQDSRESNWVYPSPAQFYAALQRKHRTEANASDMSIVVPVHNAVNEKCWADVLKWEMNEAQAQQEHVKLVSFKGRPQDLTPRARLYSLLGCETGMSFLPAGPELTSLRQQICEALRPARLGGRSRWQARALRDRLLRWQSRSPFFLPRRETGFGRLRCGRPPHQTILVQVSSAATTEYPSIAALGSVIIQTGS